MGRQQQQQQARTLMTKKPGVELLQWTHIALAEDEPKAIAHRCYAARRGLAEFQTLPVQSLRLLVAFSGFLRESSAVANVSVTADPSPGFNNMQHEREVQTVKEDQRLTHVYPP